jgi:hypothetical protein
MELKNESRLEGRQKLSYYYLPGRSIASINSASASVALSIKDGDKFS